MDILLTNALAAVRGTLEEASVYEHASGIVMFDQETICPPKAQEKQGETAAFLMNQVFKLKEKKEFREAAELLYERKNELEAFDGALAELLHRENLWTKNLSAEEDLRLSRIYNKAYVDWLKAKEADDFSLFASSLEAVLAADRRRVELKEEKKPLLYDNLLDIYERGMTSGMLDELFGECRRRLVPLLQRILSSKKKIRTDFASRLVPDHAQSAMARYLLETMGYDFARGNFATTEHPFTSGVAVDDIRVTTHFYPDMFLSNIYSIVHEGGHALFDQNQPRENWEHFITGGKTMGQHESVSRFYENRIGRSEAFIELIYPKARELFPEALADVTARELYEAANVVSPSFIRTEADEFTYTFHIILRYELEKRLLKGEIGVAELPEAWGALSEELLGIRPSTDREGVLQDVHWTGGFGYFPTYALGNFYNAMYYNKMAEEIDIDGAVRAGDFERINGWMAERVFKKADRLAPADWIREITGRTLTPEDFLDYLEKKYTALYEI